VAEQAGTPRRFRWEIEGLRAVAALLVAVYHVWFGRVSGGVDVFFVIAGFMVTTSLLGHVERTGRVQVGRYLGQLLKRLLPNALLVLVAVAAATMVWVPVTRRQDVLLEIAASALYAENWLLAAQSVDYLQRDATNSPVQHYWAMSIQGQFYLAWLALFLLVLAVSSAEGFRRRLAQLLVLSVGASFAFSVWFTAADQPVAYFHTGARLWEFGAGGLVAVFAASLPELSRRLSFVLGWVGLLLIVSCGMVLSVGTSFPGWVALWPVLGAVLILVAGHTPARWSASSVLSSKPLVRLGAVSYALYLWHWPLLVFYLLLTQQDRAGFLPGVLIIAASVALSFLSTAWVETPLRSTSLDRRRPWAVTLAGSSAAVLVATGAAAAGEVSRPDTTAQRPVPTGPGAGPGSAGEGARLEDLRADNTDDPAPGIAFAAQDRSPAYDLGCHQTLREPAVETCTFGDEAADRTMFLVGSSHAVHWQPALTAVAEQHGWRLVVATKSSCRTGAHHEPDRTGASAEVGSCTAWSRDVTARIIAEQPDLVVTTSTVAMGEPEHVPPSFVRTWEELAEHDIPVLALRDTPFPGRDVVECLAVRGATSRACDTPLEQTLAAVDPASELPDLPDNVTLADLTSSFCAEGTCPAVVGDVVVYHDHSHISRTYSTLLAPVLLGRVPALG
jgi:peptidoglycan/LPS O-acetylase OafA/YrhL